MRAHRSGLGRWARRGALAALIAAGVAGVTAPARAQSGDGSLDRGPTSELYLRKRPPVPAAPVLSAELKRLLNSAERKRDDKRLEAIKMLRAFLQSGPVGEGKADGQFKLAELLWEEARRLYLVSMDGFDRKLEACRQQKGGCTQPPAEPRIELKESEALYKGLLAEFPTYRRADLVVYLVGFAAKEDGREEEAMGRFRQVIEDHPTSPLYGDSWMMIGEHFFAMGDKWEEARSAYAEVLTRPDAATYDLALFKTAWCDWKLGAVDEAAKKFTEVIKRTNDAKRAGSARARQAATSLGEEALEYLVVVFTEDRTISAREVADFLASIGGEKFSRDILVKVAESYVGQAEYDRANDTFKFLIQMDPEALAAAQFQRSIVENWNNALDPQRAQVELKALLDSYGPESAWAKQQRNKDALTRSMAATEQLARQTATNIHAEAQSREKNTKCTIPMFDPAGAKPRCDIAPLVGLYEKAAAGYELYLSAFGKGRAASGNAVEVRMLRAEILYRKLWKLEEAGDEYVGVGKTAPVGKYHKDALLNAMNAYEAARPKDTLGKRQLLPIDAKFADAIDLYATLFPADTELVGIIYKNGKLFYDYGDYDNAIKRFGLIVTRYPDHEDAKPAGLHILDALVKGGDYENVEDWARKLKKAKAFAAKDQQDRLDKLIVDSIGKSGDKYKEQAQKYREGDKPEQAAESFVKAAGFYLRIPKEFPSNPKAAEKMLNAGIMYKEAREPERAAEVYLGLAEKYPSSPEADKAAFFAGEVYESVAYFDRAAEAYELSFTKFGKGARAADALFNAGRLRQALGQYDKAIAHYQAYAKGYRDRPDASAVAFNVGVVYEEQGEDGRAEQAFADYARRGDKRALEAHVRAGRAGFRLGQLRRASDHFASALGSWKRTSGKDKADVKGWAAEARYYQGELLFREYEKVSLDVKPKLLNKSLKKKLDLLQKAQGLYESIADFEDAKWGTAALFRAGHVFELFSDSLTNAATPKGLTEDEANAYREGLDLYVVQVQEIAASRYATGYQLALKQQIYNEYTRKIREGLGRLDPAQFPPEREGRTRERIGDRPLGIEPVTEVVR